MHTCSLHTCCTIRGHSHLPCSAYAWSRRLVTACLWPAALRCMRITTQWAHRRGPHMLHKHVPVETGDCDHLPKHICRSPGVLINNHVEERFGQDISATGRHLLGQGGEFRGVTTMQATYTDIVSGPQADARTLHAHACLHAYVNMCVCVHTHKQCQCTTLTNTTAARLDLAHTHARVRAHTHTHTHTTGQDRHRCGDGQ